MTETRFIFAIDHRPPMAQACAERSLPTTRISEFKSLAVDAVCAARDLRPAVAGNIAMLLDDAFGKEAIKLARSRHLPAGQPVEKGSVVPLEFERPDWKETIVGAHPPFVKVRINGRPDAPRSEREQEKRLLEISRACEEKNVALMPEPLLQPTPKGAEAAIFDAELRPKLLAQWMTELREAGLVTRWWKIEGLDSEDAVRQVAEALVPSERVLILGMSAPMEKLRVWFSAARGQPQFSGFAVGRSIFWEPFLAYLGGASQEEVRSAMRDRFLAVLDLWTDVNA